MPVLTTERDRIEHPRDRERPGQDRRPSRWRTAGVVALVGVAALGVGRLVDLLPSFSNPFTTETVDRTGPALLEAVQDLSRYQAASGQFQVIVDLEEDARFIPDFIRGERTLFVASGSVDASVDFSAIGEGSITVSPDGEEVRITLPHAQLSDARVDPEASRVVARQRGLLDRLGGVFSDNPTGERQLYLLAGKKLEAAALEAGIRDRAEANTRAMLESMLASLGYEQVTVTFGDPDA